MNVPVPPVFLYERELARWEVMDGRQRLTTLREFYANEFALTGLEYWPQLEGRRYSELPSKIRDGIDRRYISSIILLKETAADEEQAVKLKKMVFERLNSGGVRLSSQETRNAIYDGPLNQLCLELSRNTHFKKLWGIPDDPVSEEDGEDEAFEPDDSTRGGRSMFAKMDDVELVLRFFAYRQLPSYRSGLNKITTFLDRFLIEGNRFPKSNLKKYRTMFETTTSFLFNALGIGAFCAIGRPRARPSKIIYDPIMYVANSMSPNERGWLLQGKQALRKELEAMYAEHHQLFAGRRTNTKDALKRDACMVEAFRSALNKTQ
jgi:hypothetical protein